MITVMIGGQWGDEGKGGIADFLSNYHKVFVRFNGGPNAGNSVMLGNGEKFVFKLLPAGGLKPGAILVLTEGMCIDVDALRKEIDKLREINPNFTVLVSEKAIQINLDHKIIDEGNKSRLGSVGVGVGPANVDRIKRRADTMKMYRSNEWFSVGDTGEWLNDHLKEDILFIGAHGTELDIHQGGFPYVTTSNCISSSIGHQAGVHPSLVDRTVLCVKAYSTRVGPGEFNDLVGPVEEKIRLKGHEFGSVSGRPRRIGWIDLKQLKRSVRINRPTMIALTMVDVLAGFEKVGVWTTEGKLEYMEGWATEDIKEFVHLDQKKKSPFTDYISYIERAVGCKIEIVSYGPEKRKKAWIWADSLSCVRHINHEGEEGEWR